jgi:hypothetical protein
MPNYVVAVTETSEYEIDAKFVRSVTDTGGLVSALIYGKAKPLGTRASVSVIRRDPQLLLPAAATRTYKIEYRKGGKLIFEHVTRRSNPGDARVHARKIEVMLAEMHKLPDEVRIREISPEPMLERRA